MFYSISWQAYWTSIAVLASVYYLIIYLIYYRSGLKGIIKMNLKNEGLASAFDPSSLGHVHSDAENLKQATLFENETTSAFTVPEENTEERIVYSCMDEVIAFFEGAKRTKWEKQGLKMALYTILQKYPSLATSQYKESISNVIVSECEHLCSIHLTADDIVGVWFG